MSPILKVVFFKDSEAETKTFLVFLHQPDLKTGVRVFIYPRYRKKIEHLVAKAHFHE